MKDIDRLKDYRKKYKRYYGIEFDRSYAIHHIDGNHENNDMRNLLLLPTELHSRYHFLRSCVEHGDRPSLDISSNIYGNLARGWYYEQLDNFLKCQEECGKRYDFKLYLDGELPNIHGITLEG